MKILSIQDDTHTITIKRHNILIKTCQIYTHEIGFLRKEKTWYLAIAWLLWLLTI